MAEKIKRKFRQMKKGLCEAFPLRQEYLDTSSSEVSYKMRISKPVQHEKRRKEAEDYLIRNFLEAEIREKELRSRLESYNPIRRWLYKRYLGLKDYVSILKYGLGQPVTATIFVFSPWINIIFVSFGMWKVGSFIDAHILKPYNYPLTLLIATFWAYLPFEASVLLYDHIQTKRRKKILKEEYGIEL